mmetsp:Transcript_39490/g.97767  ORF Transcript_39490/g.97767 Transcript_39490/m.97767 type:complete len:202 (-) Transcript_39490:76-681(-)
MLAISICSSLLVLRCGSVHRSACPPCALPLPIFGKGTNCSQRIPLRVSTYSKSTPTAKTVPCMQSKATVYTKFRYAWWSVSLAEVAGGARDGEDDERHGDAADGHQRHGVLQRVGVGVLLHLGQPRLLLVGAQDLLRRLPVLVVPPGAPHLGHHHGTPARGGRQPRGGARRGDRHHTHGHALAGGESPVGGGGRAGDHGAG